jgi:hypothetical protein
MPNWVFNSLVVSGEQSELDKMVAQLNQPFTMHHPVHDFVDGQYTKVADFQEYNNPVFAFWNIVKPTDISTYYAEEVFKKTKLEADEFMAEFVRSMKEDQDWYHWNVRNWGTKWDVAVSDGNEYPNTTMEVNEDGSVMYRFETAWSPVGEVLIKLSEQFPTLNFDYEYEEETGWGGVAVFENGTEISCDQWDSPMSHQDYKDRDKECQCEYDDDSDYWFEDCPVDTTKYKWDSELEQWSKILDNSHSIV